MHALSSWHMVHVHATGSPPALVCKGRSEASVVAVQTSLRKGTENSFHWEVFQ